MSDVKYRSKLAGGFGIVAAISVAASVAAFGSTAITVPADPVSKAAFDALDKHCARCHQDGRLVKYQRPAKGFGFVLKLDQLAADSNYVRPGIPSDSRLFNQIISKEMPYDVIYEGATPDMTEVEITAIKTWIEALGTKAACVPRDFVKRKDAIELMAADLGKLSNVRAKGTRYLTLSHLKNACVDDEAMKVYRQGAIKLVNSLSRSSDVVRLETIDPGQTILRINLDDLGWNPADWDTVVAAYPYNTEPDTRLADVLEKATGSKLPYVRADWFTAKASLPPLYNRLLKLPATFQALAREQGVDVDDNIKKFAVHRAGVQKSGVSQSNRLIERHRSRHGFFWTSYDFAGNTGKQSLFLFPLGPGGDNGFQHDGGETIFTLPNGFQAYYLNDVKGASLDKGPTSIVIDPERKDKTVTNGISCMGCHDQGMRNIKDDIRGAVTAGALYPREVKSAVEQLYPPRDQMDRIIENDTRRFKAAMALAGLDSTLKLHGAEMINALAKRYDEDVDLRLAAAEIGMTAEEFARVARDGKDENLRRVLRRLEQAAVPRDQFEGIYAALAKDIGEEKSVVVAAPPGAPAAAVAPTAASAADLSLTSDKSTYKPGESPVFTIISSRDCFLTLSDVDDKGAAIVLFPNKFQQDNKIRAKAVVQLPGAAAQFKYVTGAAGFETITAVCTEQNVPVDGIRHNFRADDLTKVPNYSRSVVQSRVLDIRPKGESRAAIKFEVK